ncbi:hypothetical protein MKW98_027300 [Papaver atlanticum]|uniref:Neprosin PEP catalytic domain-containing protein n=1 Tax=Papaver atlanticum TaxID=357466 RepID=A0AAD4XJ91_9MAGN|nr:hypothetical protein MKW98_027300 [Papaver atlanticum]
MKYLRMILMFFVLVSSSLVSTTHCVDGKRNISKAEANDMEIEKKLRILNKEPVKTIITEVGDTIDCINIYKQPAFDNPLLKDHKLKERCPLGTIPIRIKTKKQLLNAKYFITKSKSIYENSYPNIGYHFVFAEEIVIGKRYFGGAAFMSGHNLTVDPNQFSTSQIWIMNATEQEINTIEFGIMKHPEVFGDSLTRLFGSWIRGHQIYGCYNVLCNGFIQVSYDVFFGQTFSQSSIYGQVSYDVYLMVSKDLDGDWWLSMGPNAEATENIGYWPYEILTLLRTSASAVRYGGYVGATSQAATPPMVNGYLPQLGDYMKTTFMRKMKYTNEMGGLVNLYPHSVRTINGTVPQCYNVMFAGHIGSWENTMAYG